MEVIAKPLIIIIENSQELLSFRRLNENSVYFQKREDPENLQTSQLDIYTKQDPLADNLTEYLGVFA